MNYEITKDDLKQIRKCLNFGRDEFAKRLRVATSTIYGWENGTRNIPDTTKILVEFYLISIFEISSSQGNIGVFGASLGFTKNFIRHLTKYPKKGTRIYLMGLHYRSIHLKYVMN